MGVVLLDILWIFFVQMLPSRVIEPKVDISKAYVEGSMFSKRVIPMYCGSECRYTYVLFQPYSLEPHGEG